MKPNAKFWIRTGLSLCLLVAISACAPSLRIRHQDPSTRKVAIQLNGEVKGTLQYGDERNFSLKKGVHRLQILTLPGNTNKWSDDGQPWEFFLEDNVELTLLPVFGMGEGEWDLFFQDQEPQVVPEGERNLHWQKSRDKKKKK